MQSRKQLTQWILSYACLSSVTILGCAPTRSSLVTATGTNIGVDIAQDPATQTPHAKLGYQRVEMAIVPTNRSADAEPGSAHMGAKDHGEVLLELRYGGIFDLGASSGIYQRLAVGDTAVRQPGASLMFARDADGNIDSESRQAVESLESIPASKADVLARKYVISVARRNATPAVRDEIDEIVKAQGFASYDAFAGDQPSEPTDAQLDQIESALKGKNIL